MSKQSPPTYNIYFVAGSLSRSSGTLSSSPRPATPEVIASVQASSSHFQPDVSAPRRPPLPPGRFSNSAPAAAAARPRLPAAPISVAPGPPRPSRAPIILKEARSNARDRSLSSRGRSRSPAHSAHRASSIASIRSERPVERPPGTWDAEGIWQTPLYSVHAVDAFPSFPHSPTQPVTPFNVFQSNLGGLTNAIRPLNLPPPPPPPLSEKLVVTENQSALRAWFRKHQDVNHPIRDSMLKYLARVLDDSGIPSEALTDLRILNYDPQYHESHAEDLTVKKYYILRGQFSARIIPDPIRAAPALNIAEVIHVQLAHSTSTGGLKGILKDGAIAPSRLHFDYSQSCFSLGAKRTGDIQWDRAELSRIVHHAWCANKNSSNVVVLALGWGDGQVIKSGGEAACLEKTLQGGGRPS